MLIEPIPPTKNITFYASTNKYFKGSSVIKYGVRTDYEVIEATGSEGLRVLGLLLAPFYAKNKSLELNNCIPIITESGYRKLSFGEERMFLKALKNPDTNILQRTDSSTINLLVVSLFASNYKRLSADKLAAENFDVNKSQM